MLLKWSKRKNLKFTSEAFENASAKNYFFGPLSSEDNHGRASGYSSQSRINSCPLSSVLRPPCAR